MISFVWLLQNAVCADKECYSLALCELYIVTAILALRVLPNLKLHDTVYEDIKYDFDALTSQPKKGARGVRITAA
jgi:hypothetical protein